MDTLPAEAIPAAEANIAMCQTFAVGRAAPAVALLTTDTARTRPPAPDTASAAGRRGTTLAGAAPFWQASGPHAHPLQADCAPGVGTAAIAVCASARPAASCAPPRAPARGSSG
eukprot:5549602-Prymnesium_polylepis.1